MSLDNSHSSTKGVDAKAALGSYDPETNTVTLRGDWDLSSKEELRKLTDRLRPNYATIDLIDMTFLDSSVLNELVQTNNRIRAIEGRLRVRIGGGQVARLLKITGLDQVLELERKEP